MMLTLAWNCKLSMSHARKEPLTGVVTVTKGRDSANRQYGHLQGKHLTNNVKLRH